MKKDNTPLLLDTNILIDYLRGQKQAITFLENTNHPLITSVINVTEVFSGVRDGEEHKILDYFIHTFEIIHINYEIATIGGMYHRNYGKTYGTGLADAIIAASATVKNARLVTLNIRHFPMLSDVLIPYKKINS